MSRRGRVLLRPGCVLNHVEIVGVLGPGLFGRMSVSVSLGGYSGERRGGGSVSMGVFAFASKSDQPSSFFEPGMRNEEEKKIERFTGAPCKKRDDSGGILL